MDENNTAFIVWLCCNWGCALLFVGIGIYAIRLKKPMWFYSGTTVDPETVTDIRAYNHENARMWWLYSIPLWISGPVWLLNHWVAVALMLLTSTAGIGWLIWYYGKIEKQYIHKK